MESNSPMMSMNAIDWRKVGIGASVAVAGALLTYLSAWITNIDFGTTLTPLVVAVWSIVANIVRKYLADYTS